MDAVTVLCAVGAIHCALYFFNTVFKSCCHYPYLNLLKKTGLDVNFMTLKFFTSVLNRPLQKWGIWRPRFLQWWFSLGTAVSLCLLPIAIIILARSFILELMRRSSSDVPFAVVLEPVIPGYNLPFSDIGYYAITLLVCTFVHEMGHAVAAVREDVHIYGTGFFLVFIFPAACVYLDSSQLNALAASRRLRILCAGIWHNVVLAVVAILLVFSLPWAVQPFFMTGDGVYVTSISPESGVLGPKGLHQSDVVTSLNDCSVKNTLTWKKCLLEALQNHTPGYCISAEFVRENDESIPEHPVVGGGVECCTKESNQLGRLCFQIVDDSGGPVELPEHSCLSARELIEAGNGLCSAQSLSSCASHLHCLRPTVGNFTKLVTLQRSKGEVVLFLGNPSEIYQTVKVTDFVPKWNMYNPRLPQIVETFLKYVYMMSSGLAIINVLPAFFFDGQHIAVALCDFLLETRVKDSTMRLAVSLCATVLGTLLLIFGVFTPLVVQYI